MGRLDKWDYAGVFMMTKIEFESNAVLIDASIIGQGLGLEASSVPILMRMGAITSLCERGIGTDDGRFRITFFYDTRQFHLIVDAVGNILEHSTIASGDRPLPSATPASS